MFDGPTSGRIDFDAPLVAFDLSVVGDEDALTPPALSRAMAAAIPGATLTVIPRAGHLANIDAPDDFDRALRDLVRRAAAS